MMGGIENAYCKSVKGRVMNAWTDTSENAASRRRLAVTGLKKTRADQFSMLDDDLLNRLQAGLRTSLLILTL
jgi:hypothetical protein